MFTERRLTSLLLLLTLIMLVLGSFVHNFKAGLACNTWPLCSGELSPEYLVKIAHRIFGMFTGLINIVLLILVRRNPEISRRTKNLTALSLILVLFQGCLGAVTIYYKLPVLVSTAHLALSMVYLLLVVYLWRQVRKSDIDEMFDRKEEKLFKQTWNPKILDGVYLSVVLIFSQVLLGAHVRHSGLGSSCGLGTNYLTKCFDPAAGVGVWWPSMDHLKLHMGHRIWGVLVAFAVFYFCLKQVFYFAATAFSPKNQLRYAAIAFVPVITILMQVFFGMALIAFEIHFIPTSLHLLFAAISLVSTWICYLLTKEVQDKYLENVHTIFADYVDLLKPRLTMLVLATCLIGMLVAPEGLTFFAGLEFLIYMVGVVGGACALNCYIEREVDKSMERTSSRPLPSGRISEKHALVFSLVLSAGGLIGLLVRFNVVTFFLGLLALLLYLFAYTPLKQKSLSSLWMGAISGALPPMIGWTAVTGEIGAIAFIMFLIMFVWQLPHFLSISLYLKDDYSKASILVYPNIYGVKVTKKLIVILTALLVLSSLLPFWIGKSNADYRNASVVLGALFMIVALLGLSKDDDQLVKRWAKNYFWGSIIYLPILFIFLLFFTV